MISRAVHGSSYANYRHRPPALNALSETVRLMVEIDELKLRTS
jgi:hypothetical protein